jgi:putative membrane protein
MPFLIHFLISMVAILIISYLFPQVMTSDSFMAALVAAFVLGIVNAVIRPVMIILTLPITLLTLGIFLLVINGLMLWIVSGLVPGFRVNGLFGAVLGSVLISLVSWVLSRGIRSKWS